MPQFTSAKALATPTLVGLRVPSLKLHDDRVIRLLETLLKPGGFLAEWNTRDVHARILARYRSASDSGVWLLKPAFASLGSRQDIATASTHPTKQNSVGQAFHQVDVALTHHSATLGLTPPA